MISECILEGERVRLRPVAEGDLPLFVRWLNDREVRRWLSGPGPDELTLEAEREWYEEMRVDPRQVVWGIETEEGHLIGNVDLHSINEEQGRADLGIVIGDKDHWARGYGTAAIREVLRYAFGELGLRRVQLLVDGDNPRAIRCYEKCGFAREGLLREHRLRDGKPVSALLMAALREDWENGGR